MLPTQPNDDGLLPGLLLTALLFAVLWFFLAALLGIGLMAMGWLDVLRRQPVIDIAVLSASGLLSGYCVRLLYRVLVNRVRVR